MESRSASPAKDQSCCPVREIRQSSLASESVPDGPTCHFSDPSRSSDAVGKENTGPRAQDRRSFLSICLSGLFPSHVTRSMSPKPVSRSRGKKPGNGTETTSGSVGRTYATKSSFSD